MGHIKIIQKKVSKEENDVLEKLKKYEARGMRTLLPIVWDKAEGVNVWDIKGNKYLDFTSTIFTANSGHSKVSKAVRKQSNKLMASYCYATKERADLLEYMVKTSPKFVEKGMLYSTGAEATECAIKLMRLKGMQKDPNKKIILSFNGAMHGKTLLNEQLSGQSPSNHWAQSTDTNIRRFHFPKKKADFIEEFNIELTRKNLDNVAGIIIESYRGWDAKFFPKKYIEEIIAMSKKFDFLVCFDEIQAGYYRTGKKFGFQHYGVEPDLITVGKGLGGGLPISAVLGKKEILDIPSQLSSTHSGNPLCCAGALDNLVFLDTKIKKKIKDKSDLFRDILLSYEDFKNIKEVNVKGMVAAIIFNEKKNADIFVYECYRNGLLVVHTGKESVKIAPPLIISEEAMLEGLNIIGDLLR